MCSVTSSHSAQLSRQRTTWDEGERACSAWQRALDQCLTRAAATRRQREPASVEREARGWPPRESLADMNDDTTALTPAHTYSHACLPTQTPSPSQYTLTAASQLPTSSASAGAFVARNATRLTLDGGDFRAVGADVYWLALDENVVPSPSYPSKSRVLEAMAVAAAMGASASDGSGPWERELTRESCQRRSGPSRSAFRTARPSR